MSRRDEAIKIKMEKSAAFMGEVDTLLQNKFYNTLINRLYYSCFHATKALLLTKDLVSKTHSGVVSLLNQKFVFENTFDKQHAAFFKKLMEERVEDDYGDFMIANEKEVIGFIEPAKQYVEYVSKLIEGYFANQRNENTSESHNNDAVKK